MLKPVYVRTLVVTLLLVACSVTPSRVPLGGNYALPEEAPASDRRAHGEAATPPHVSSSQPDTSGAGASATVATGRELDAGHAGHAGDAREATTVAEEAPGDAIHFEPLRVGSQVKAEITLGTSIEMHGGPPGMRGAKLSLESRLRFELKVRKASSQSLDEIELSLTTLSTHVESDGRGSDIPAEPPETYDITLTGRSPNIRPRSGKELDPLARLKLALLLVPLAEFCAHWADSPTLLLKPGWTSQVPLPFAAALFTAARGESMALGPLDARFTAHSAPSAEVPFELGLPLHYGSPLGNIAVDLTGSAKLNPKSGRPSAFELSGPLRATGGSRAAPLSITGTASFAATLTYP